jgi:UDP-N-acetylglucosamine acyltransferase
LTWQAGLLPHFEDVIHPTAIIHPNAKLDPTVRVGPAAVIDPDVEVGPHCVIGPHAYLTGVTRIGSHNSFHAGCVIGDAPQDLKYHGEPTRVRIGDYNVFREHCTVHRSTDATGETTVGSHGFFMANAHFGHNSQVGDHVILANGALLGGHAVVQDRAFISGNCLIHQFTRVGRLAIMQGGAGISKDVPPFTVAMGVNTICGLNSVGLRRAGFSAADRLELKRLYHALFRSGQNLRVATTAALASFQNAAARELLDFVAAAKRGVCCDIGESRETQAKTAD